MQQDAWIQLLLRTLPTITFVVLGFVAASDKKTRERWGDLLYQVGSIRPDQREDPKIGSGVKWPFLIFALALIIWPISYYRVATRRFEVKSDIYSRPAATIYNTKTNPANAAAGNTVTGNTVTPATAPQPAVTAPANTPAAATPNNIYGQPR